jgi:hypothetical protein
MPRHGKSRQGWPAGMTRATAALSAAVALAPLKERFTGELSLIFLPGPSLPKLWQAGRRPEWPSIAVNDAWKIAPDSDILYGTDSRWWRYHKLCPEFKGIKIGANDRTPCPEIINLEFSGEAGFDPRLGWVRHGWSSGYAAAHLASQLGSPTVVLIGADCREVDGKTNFFGHHDPKLGSHPPNPYELWIAKFDGLAKELKKRGVELLSATPGSALRLPTVDLEWLCPEH